MSVEQRNGPGVPKAEWGPKEWNRLHVLAINYPQDPTWGTARVTFRRIWGSVSRLPCPTCRMHGIRYITRNPPDLSGTEALQAWMWRFHNAVNALLDKPLASFQDYLRFYADELCWANWSAGCRAGL